MKLFATAAALHDGVQLRCTLRPLDKLNVLAQVFQVLLVDRWQFYLSLLRHQLLLCEQNAPKRCGIVNSSCLTSPDIVRAVQVSLRLVLPAEPAVANV